MEQDKIEFNDPLSQLPEEDFTPAQRVHHLRDRYQHRREMFEQNITPELATAINDAYDITFVFNTHGDQVDALRTVEAIWKTNDPESEKPFITFIEATHNDDLHKPGMFSFSIDSAFKSQFEGQSTDISDFYLPEASQKAPWAYWRDRGLLERGSIIVPVDLRRYSAQYVETLIGQPYGPEFLYSMPNAGVMMQSSFDETFLHAKSHGLLIAYSNGLRELATASQITSVLSKTLGNQDSGLQITDDQRKKLSAIRNERLEHQDKLPVYVAYGSGHHSMVHLFSKNGIDVNRTFPTSATGNGSLSVRGHVMDQFFSSHIFDLRPIDINKYARHSVLSYILNAPLRQPADYGCVIEADNSASWAEVYAKINHLARNEELNENIESVYSEFAQRPFMAVEMLQSVGIPIRHI